MAPRVRLPDSYFPGQRFWLYLDVQREAVYSSNGIQFCIRIQLPASSFQHRYTAMEHKCFQQYCTDCGIRQRPMGRNGLSFGSQSRVCFVLLVWFAISTECDHSLFSVMCTTGDAATSESTPKLSSMVKGDSCLVGIGSLTANWSKTGVYSASDSEWHELKAV